MWRSSFILLRHRAAAARIRKPPASGWLRPCLDGSGGNRDGCFCGFRLMGASYCSSAAAAAGGGGEGKVNGEMVSDAEVKRLMRLVNVEALKEKLGMENKEVIEYSELLRACEGMGIAKSPDEAAAFARVLDEAGVVLIFRDKVHLYPHRVIDQVRKAVPIALLPEDESSIEELKKLQERMDELDKIAHKQVSRILWTGMGGAVLLVGLFFRLTFWEFSWDVMEPIAFFATTSGIIIGYTYFLFTSRDPTYQDILKRLYLSRQKKLIKKHGFDLHRFVELQKKCKLPMDGATSIKRRIGVELEELHDMKRHYRTYSTTKPIIFPGHGVRFSTIIGCFLLTLNDQIQELFCTYNSGQLTLIVSLSFQLFSYYQHIPKISIPS